MACLNLPSHVKYFLRCLDTLPMQYVSLDTNRMTIVFFCVAGLDLLCALDKLDTRRIISWIYAQQASISAYFPSVLLHSARPTSLSNVSKVLPTSSGEAGGFRGGPFLGGEFAGRASSSVYDTGHIAMTYTAIALLIILGDNLSSIDRGAVLSLVKSLQASPCERPPKVRQLIPFSSLWDASCLGAVGGVREYHGWRERHAVCILCHRDMQHARR